MIYYFVNPISDNLTDTEKLLIYLSRYFAKNLIFTSISFIYILKKYGNKVELGYFSACILIGQVISSFPVGLTFLQFIISAIVALVLVLFISRAKRYIA